MVHWDPSSRAKSHSFTGTRVRGSSEQRVGRLQLVLNRVAVSIPDWAFGRYLDMAPPWAVEEEPARIAT